MFWVDEIVEDIEKKINLDTYLVSDWMTTSGHAHIGSLRGTIVHDLIRRGLSEKEKKAEFQWGFDDFDPMDGLPNYIDSSFEKYMGLPLCNIPAPNGKDKSFAKQYANEFKEIMEGLGIKAKIVYNSEFYKTGKYNEAIKVVLNNAQEIRKIYTEISGSQKEENWYPLQVICPKCGKIGTTIVTGWDGSEVEFECRENLVSWARGCGFKGKISPFNGNAKMPWKTEWPCKWLISGSDIEGEGKDHFASGGSRDIADKIYHDIFKKEPPYDIRYEFFLIGGKKMSGSKGLGVAAIDMYKFLPANILRFLFTRTKYKKALEFNPEGDAVPLLYDEFDRCAKAYSQDPNSDLGRAYYYAEVNPDKELPQYLLRFSKIAFMLQMPKVDIFEYARAEKASELSGEEKAEIENRIEIAKKWLGLYAPDNYKFVIQDKIPDISHKLSAEQKRFLHRIAEILETQKLSGEDLHQKIHDIKNQLNIAPRDAFSAIYLSFLGKESGPQAGWLLASLDQEFVIKRLQEASE